MKKGILYGSLFIIIVSASVLALEYRYKNYSTVTDSVYQNLDVNKLKLTHLYIGNSHTINLGTYTNDSNAFVGNFGYQGLDLFKTFALLRKWIPQMKQLKYVYLGLDYEVLGQNQSLSGEEYLDRQFFKYTDTLYKFNVSNVLMSKSNFFRANRDLSYLFKSSSVKKDATNFIPLDTKKGNLNDAGCKKRAREHSLIKFKKNLLNENLAYLNEIIQICKKQHVELILFNSPKTSCFRNYVVQENVQLAHSKIDSLLQVNQLHYYDYYSSKDFVDSDFKDYDHLNLIATKRMIDLINRERDRIAN